MSGNEPRAEDLRPIVVGFVDNPNCGKTTLFNALTGAKLEVANWPGVTVERVRGETSYKGRPARVISTLGIYSLTSYTIEEIVTRKYTEDGEVNVIINVVGTPSLERDLYLTLQPLELKKPAILALNMMDIVEEWSMEIDLHRLPEMLGEIPAVPVSARERTGLDALMHAVMHHYEEGPHGIVVRYDDTVGEKIEKVEVTLKIHYGDLDNMCWHAIKVLEYDEGVSKDHPVNLSDVVDKSYERQTISQKYNYIEEVIGECLFNKEKKAASTGKIGTYLTHSVWGIPIFLGIMALVLFPIFTVGDFLKEYFQIGPDWLSVAVLAVLENLHVSPLPISLIADGIIAGVGGTLTFLFNIFTLFLTLVFLEDSGYMARVAYVTNETMSMAGLSGKAFLPMLPGFGCMVPVAMAIRALVSEWDRRRTIPITPSMSCSARLPIYVLSAEVFSPSRALMVVYSLYLTGLLVAIVVTFVARKTFKSTEEGTLLIELPEYKTPNGRTVVIYVWDKVKDYLSKAGTTIFIASIVLWFVLNIGPSGLVSEVPESSAATVGHILVSVLRPAGLSSWQIAVALISGLSAEEVVVSGFSVLHGVSNIDSQTGMMALSKDLAVTGLGAVNAYALMIFRPLYSPCIAVVTTIKRETCSWHWALGLVAFQTATAWVMSMLVYQLGSLILG